MEFKCGSVFIREMCFQQAGAETIGHAHNFDHTTYVVRGAIRVEKLGPPVQKVDEHGEPYLEPGPVLQTVEKRASDGKNWVLILAGVHHRITALEDLTIAHCTYSHRIPQALVDKAGTSKEYDELLARLMALANEAHGDIVQEWTGWEAATN